MCLTQLQMEITAFLFPISGVVFLPLFNGRQREVLARRERHRALISIALCSTATSTASNAIAFAQCTIVVTMLTEATVLVPSATASSRAVTPIRP